MTLSENYAAIDAVPDRDEDEPEDTAGSPEPATVHSDGASGGKIREAPNDAEVDQNDGEFASIDDRTDAVPSAEDVANGNDGPRPVADEHSDFSGDREFGSTSDPENDSGMVRLLELDREITRKIQRYRSEGKDPHDLFDPSKPDYLGTPKALAPYVADRPSLLPVQGEERASKDHAFSGSTASEREAATGAFEAAAHRIRRSVLHDRQFPAAAEPNQQLLSERLAEGFKAPLLAAGVSPEAAGPIAEALAAVASLHPAISVPLALDEMAHAGRSGDPLALSLAGATLIPGAKTARTVYQASRGIFREAYPSIERLVIVHHANPLETLRVYPDLFTLNELQALDNLRGIPKELNNWLHHSEIRTAWNKFFRENETATRETVLEHVKAIDDEYGHLFLPPRTSTK